MNSRIGTSTAKTKPDEEGTIAASNTAARQSNAISLRVEIKAHFYAMVAAVSIKSKSLEPKSRGSTKMQFPS